jgi:hypothetical protein
LNLALTKAAARHLAVSRLQSDNGPKDDLELVLLVNSATQKPEIFEIGSLETAQLSLQRPLVKCIK